MTTASCDRWSSGLAKSDRIGEVPHAHATFGQVVDEVQGVPDGAAQPIQGAHDDHVAIAGLVQGLVESGPVGGGSGFLIHVDSFGGDALAAQRVDLSVQILFRGRHAGVPNIHAPTVSNVCIRTADLRRSYWDYLWNGFRRRVGISRMSCTWCSSSKELEYCLGSRSAVPFAG